MDVAFLDEVAWRDIHQDRAPEIEPLRSGMSKAVYVEQQLVRTANMSSADAAAVGLMLHSVPVPEESTRHSQFLRR